MRKIYTILAMSMLLVSFVCANYTGNYGKTDNIEIGFDMTMDFIFNLLPYAFYLILIFALAFGLLKLRRWLDSH